MRVLVADDDPLAVEVLTRTLVPAQHEVICAQDGGEALAILQQPDAPSLAILDWMMPVLDGPDVCRLIRSESPNTHRYLILVTRRDAREDIVAGLAAGADDYLVKPFHQGELLARVSVGVRMLALQDGLAARVAELEVTLSRVKQLSGLLPICAYCKSIRTDDNYWLAVEEYISTHSNTQFSHGVCPPCFQRIANELDEYDAKDFVRSGPASARAPLRLLLADDNVINRQVGAALLAQLGYTADVVANGAEVLSALEVGAYDAVLLDVQMPVMDGYEAARRIRKAWSGSREKARPRLIAMTSNERPADQERCFEAGMDDFLAKPLDIEILRAKLELCAPRTSL